MKSGYASQPSMREWLAEFLRCPSCAANLRDTNKALVCTRCGLNAPIRNGIPVFIDAADDALSRRTQTSFGYEWQQFSDWRPSGSANFEGYFEDADLGSLAHGDVLDAGCGMGRHARFVAAHVSRLVAIDFSAAVDSANAHLREFANVACVRADLRHLPFAPASFDFIYSLGVVHHIDDTDGVLRTLVDKLRPGGRLRIFVYWEREGWTARLLGLVSRVRRITTRMPLSMLRAACWALSVVLWLGVVLPYRALRRMGVQRQSWPLFAYVQYPFTVLFNDQFDRFSAPLEKRYSAEAARDLLARAGLSDISVRPWSGWIVEGRKT